MASAPPRFGSKGLGRRSAARRSRGGFLFGSIILGMAAAAVAAAIAFVDHRPAADVTGTVEACPARPASRKLDDCVSACISCSHGTVVTCTTACRLKGAN